MHAGPVYHSCFFKGPLYHSSTLTKHKLLNGEIILFIIIMVLQSKDLGA